MGIADYGNAMGVPHGNGSIWYHSGFAGNNLVNVFGVSVASIDRLIRNKVPTIDVPGKYVGIYVGKASDRTGLGGTKFASKGIDMSDAALNESAVQDPDPHLEEALARGIIMLGELAIAQGWFEQVGWKDMGAAGLLCSSLEQLHGVIGMTINGNLIPTNEPRTPTEFLEAETQERFFLTVHEDYAPAVLHVFNDIIGLPFINNGARAAVVARCNDTGRYTFVQDNKIHVNLPADAMMNAPIVPRKVCEPRRVPQAIPTPMLSIGEEAERVLGSMTFKSDGFIHDHYDTHVRSTNIVNRGKAAATLRTHPLFEGQVGYSMVFDSSPVYGQLDPLHQAADSLVRGAWKMAAVGCSVVGVTNNANYGRADVPEEMWAFVKGQEGVARACNNWPLEQRYIAHICQDPDTASRFEGVERPTVGVGGGNVSLNKWNVNTGTAIPPTTILGLVGWTDAPSRYATWDIKPVERGSLYLVGARQESLGGTEYLQALYGPDMLGDSLFTIDYETSHAEVSAIIDAVRSGLVLAANDIESGGLLNAVAEMMVNTEDSVTARINLNASMALTFLTARQKLYSESYGMVLQVDRAQEHDFREVMQRHGVCAYLIGSAGSLDQGCEGRLSFKGHEFTTFSMEQHALQDSYRSKIEHCLTGVLPCPEHLVVP
ncbi:hypothetical protein COV94_07070 [Candidatus Woesearchaeota archaeon CG11_big_fil_rev_8_21_14_0_20_57_5]|nr:MAG: hypothetical protein COV94_07070 [Candidatus Woesearchaeota archaeon CG11_big_fil_rev_8_21_14_0_20_57_5]